MRTRTTVVDVTDNMQINSQALNQITRATIMKSSARFVVIIVLIVTLI